jgi:hypothetical protein
MVSLDRSVGSRRWRRMRSITAACSMSAMRRRRPPQRGHARTSRPKLRRMRSAQRGAGGRGGRTRRPGGGTGASGSVALASVGPAVFSAGGASVVLGSPGLARVARRGRGLPLVRTERRSCQAGQALQPTGRRCLSRTARPGFDSPAGTARHRSHELGRSLRSAA